MSDKRIKDLATSATSPAADDFFAIDGDTNRTRKIPAASFLQDAPSDGNQYGRQSGAWAVISGGGGASYIDGEVEFHTDLPVAVGSPAIDSAYLVRKGSGIYFINRKPAGIWVRELNNGNLDDWKYAGTFSDLYRDANFRIINDVDTSKQIAFSASLIGANQTRTINVPNKNVTLDDSGDSREWTGDTVSQVEAETGTATTRRAWTAQRVFQSVAAWWAASSAKTKLDGIESGANNYVLLTPTTTIIGGVKRNAGSAGQFVNGVDTDGSLLYDTPAGGGGGGGVSAVDSTLADILSVSGSNLVADDLAADRLYGWDDSAGKAIGFTVGAGLEADGTAIKSKLVSDPTGVTGATAITNLMALTKSAYADIGSPNASTLYVITDP